MSGIIIQEALLVLLALASYRTKSRTRARHVLPLLHETYSPRNIGSKREKKKKSYAHLTYFPIYIYIHINHHLPPINSTKTAFRFPSSKRKKREVQRGQKNRKGEKEEFRKLGNGEGNRLRWHAVPLREDEGGRGRISGRNLRPRL